jgi:hypothetical protein
MSNHLRHPRNVQPKDGQYFRLPSKLQYILMTKQTSRSLTTNQSAHGVTRPTNKCTRLAAAGPDASGTPMEPMDQAQDSDEALVFALISAPHTHADVNAEADGRAPHYSRYCH